MKKKKEPTIEAWQLAMIAAPLVAKGMLVHDAIRYAYGLWRKSAAYLKDYDTVDKL